MKTKTNFVVLAILSLLVGTAFASPLLIVELSEIRPYVEPLPQGPKADIDVNVAYVNFTIGDTTQNLTDLSYFVVLNITNNSDEWAVVDLIQISSAQNITKGLSSDRPFFNSTSTSITGGDAKGAWIDGKYYNLTWVPHEAFWMNGSALITGKTLWENGIPVIGEGYWMEGVQLLKKYAGFSGYGNLTAVYMNMNGTWTDVTGRITIDQVEEPVRSEPIVGLGTIFSDMILFGGGSMSRPEEEIGLGMSRLAPVEYDTLWAPHQSRLIVLTSNRQVLSKLLRNSNVELLETSQQISVRGAVSSRLNGTTGIYDSIAIHDEIKTIPLEITDQGYLYNTILADNEIFVLDEYGIEAFIEPRN
ncbi:MAG: hypothetical protein NWF03_05490 [Candidatus Bathyarchaeota archaeon]|nr:hypothetical protein [Candidatus Bathyarchaeota archaeon]